MDANGIEPRKRFEFVAKLKLFVHEKYFSDLVQACWDNKESFPIPLSVIQEIADTVVPDLASMYFPEILDEVMKDIDIPNPININITGQLEPDKDIDEEVFFKNNKFVPKLLGDYIMKFHHFKTPIGGRALYYYMNGFYVPQGKERIKELASNIMGEAYKMIIANETINYIESSTYIDADEVNNTYINLENGLLDPMTGKMESHNPDVFSLVRIPIKYDADADCPKFRALLEEKIDDDVREVLQEMFGYCYLPGQRYEKAFLFHGPRRTGKSTILDILGRMLGQENVTAYHLQFITENIFAPAYLYGVPANICADLSDTSLKNTGMFLMITGGDKISAAKKHKDPISFYPSTKLIFSCNTIPPSHNKDLAFYRRWIVLPFIKQTKEEDINPQKRAELLEELPGILNWSLEGLRRLLEKDKFSYWMDEHQVKDMYERNSDSIQSFIYNCIDIEDDEGTVKKRVAYQAYVGYCKANSLNIDNQIKFGRMFKELTGCGTGKIGKIPGYQGVSMKEVVKSQKTLT